MKKLCVFCGSGFGSRIEYAQAAKNLGIALVKRNIGLVYGGGRVGLMGEIASTVNKSNGNVIGIIPKELFNKEVAYTELTDLRVVDTMHERKALMAELSDGFIAMPGGLGTIEEFFEVLTWTQLGFHSKPCGLLNISGYYDQLLKFLDHSVSEKFIEHEHRSMILIDDDPESLLDKLINFEPPKANKVKWALDMLKKSDKQNEIEI
ncbi:MAG: TIGR00730 family Rossman fold protein [Flavobacterium sp.]|nr:TIGR00730 family Rossman fold protein [Flavobacterium sp.]